MTNREIVNKIIYRPNLYISESLANKIMSCEYQRQAVEFLVNSETTCNIVSVGVAKPNWSIIPVNKYEVTLKNKKHEYKFDFYDSISNTEKGKSMRYDFYSVIASLSLSHVTDFDDFCSEFGYSFNNEREYIEVKQIYFNVKDQDNNLLKLFTESQLEALSEIN